MHKRIIVPLDGSQLAEQVVPYVKLLARGLGAEVRLLRAFDTVRPDMTDPEHGLYLDRLTANFRNTARDYLEEVAAGLRSAGVTTTCEAHEGSAAEQIISDAEADPEALVAMSTHGRSGVGCWFLGSVADKVLHATNNPLLIIRPREEVEVPGAICRIIVPLGESPMAEQALAHVGPIARALGLGVTLVRVTPTVADYYRFGGYLYEYSTPQGLDTSVLVDAAATEYLKAAAERLRAEGLSSVEERLLHGNAAAAILDLAQESPGAMVAMTTHGRSGIGRWVLGSVADRVVRHAGVPVLIIRPKEEAGAQS